MTSIEKLDTLNTDQMGERSTVGAVMSNDSEECEITVRLKRKEFDKLDPENIAIVQLTW